MPEIHPITFERHGSKRLLPLSSWEFAAKQNLAPLLPTEFSQAAHNYPIIFTQQQDEISCFALLGLHPGKNLLIDVKNQWRVEYIPAVFRRYPFLMARVNKEKEEFVLCIDEASSLLVDTGGKPLFDKDENKTEVLEKAFNFTSEYQKQIPVRQMFCDLIRNLIC